MPRLMVVNLAPGDTAEDIESAPPLGSQEEVRAQIGAVMPGIDFDGEGHGTFSGRAGSVTVDLGNAEPIYTAVMAVRGAAGPAVARLLEEAGWRAYVPRTGTFLTTADLRRKHE